jgi:hypothetical protein
MNRRIIDKAIDKLEKLLCELSETEQQEIFSQIIWMLNNDCLPNQINTESAMHFCADYAELLKSFIDLDILPPLIGIEEQEEALELAIAMLPCFHFD